MLRNMSWIKWSHSGSKAEHDNAGMTPVPSLGAGWWWCGTCWVLEAPCLEEADMMWGALMSCDLCCYYQLDQSWKWTATCSMMMPPDYSKAIGWQRLIHTPITSKIRWNNQSLSRNVQRWKFLHFLSCLILSAHDDGWAMIRVQTATCWSNSRTEGEKPTGQYFWYLSSIRLHLNIDNTNWDFKESEFETFNNVSTLVLQGPSLSHIHTPSGPCGPYLLAVVHHGLLFLHISQEFRWYRSSFLTILQCVGRQAGALTQWTKGQKCFQILKEINVCYLFYGYKMSTAYFPQTFVLFSCCRQQCWCHWFCHLFSVYVLRSLCCPSVLSNEKQENSQLNQNTTIPMVLWN